MGSPQSSQKRSSPAPPSASLRRALSRLALLSARVPAKRTGLHVQGVVELVRHGFALNRPADTADVPVPPQVRRSDVQEFPLPS